MINPQEKIEDLLKKLINRVVDLDAKLRDTKKFYELLNKAEYLDTINVAPHFFRMHYDSIQRDIIIVLAKTFDPSSKRSIFKLISWVRDHFSSLSYRGTPLNETSINTLDSYLTNISSVTEKIKKQRDKTLAHDDTKYFDQPFLINEESPLDFDELEEAIDSIRKVLFDIYLAIEDAHYEMRITNLTKVDFIIKLLKHQKILYNDKEIRDRMHNGNLPFPMNV